MIKFFKDAVSEIYNVTWPSKKHIKHIATVTIVFTFSCAVFVWVLDYANSNIIKTLVWTSEIQFTPKTEKVNTEWVENKIKTSDIKIKTEDWKDVKVKVNTENK